MRRLRRDEWRRRDFRLARAAVATGVDSIFMEVHEDPDRALSDGPNSYPLDKLALLLDDLKRLHEVAHEVISRA